MNCEGGEYSGYTLRVQPGSTLSICSRSTERPRMSSPRRLCVTLSSSRCLGRAAHIRSHHLRQAQPHSNRERGHNIRALDMVRPAYEICWSLSHAEGENLTKPLPCMSNSILSVVIPCTLTIPPCGSELFNNEIDPIFYTKINIKLGIRFQNKMLSSAYYQYYEGVTPRNVEIGLSCPVQ